MENLDGRDRDCNAADGSARVFPVRYPARVMLRLLKQVLDQLLVNEEGVLQLWRLDLIRCSDVSCPIHFRTIHVCAFAIATWRNASWRRTDRR